MFDEDEEQFLDGIPYPEALSRGVIRQGETWKLAANVQYIQDCVAGFEKEHEEAVQNAHEEHEEDKREGEDEGRKEAIAEVKDAIDNIMETNPRKEWETDIAKYFEELGNV